MDCGFVKQSYFDSSNGIDCLLTCPISQAAATQRAGRAGRVREGKCFRLMTEPGFRALAVSARQAACISIMIIA